MISANIVALRRYCIQRPIYCVRDTLPVQVFPSFSRSQFEGHEEHIIM